MSSNEIYHQLNQQNVQFQNQKKKHNKSNSIVSPGLMEKGSPKNSPSSQIKYSILENPNEYHIDMGKTFESPKNNNNENKQVKQKQNDDKAQKNNSEKKQIEQKKKTYDRQMKFDENRKLRVFKVLKDLYNNTSGLRNVDDQYKYYVREIENQQALYKNYSLTLQNKAIVGKNCNAFIQVRGDGNCFYTAFGFQFLNHLLFTYSDEEFTKFIQNILKLQMRFTIQYIKQSINDQKDEKYLLDEFIYIIEELRQVQIESRFSQFKDKFAQWQIKEKGDGFLYCLQTLFFRNLSYYYLEQSDFKDVVLDKENLLIWEEECNTNEVIIKLLAQQLKIHIKLLFLENEVILREYEEENQNIIILLIKPGHYNIGWNIPIQ